MSIGVISILIYTISGGFETLDRRYLLTYLYTQRRPTLINNKISIYMTSIALSNRYEHQVRLGLMLTMQINIFAVNQCRAALCRQTCERECLLTYLYIQHRATSINSKIMIY